MRKLYRNCFYYLFNRSYQVSNHVSTFCFFDLSVSVFYILCFKRNILNISKQLGIYSLNNNVRTICQLNILYPLIDYRLR